MKIGKIVAMMIVLALMIFPAFASDIETEDIANAESSTVEDQGDSTDAGMDSVQADTLVVLNEIAENQGVINNNLVFLAAAVLAAAGLIVGYLAGKDILSIWLA